MWDMWLDGHGELRLPEQLGSAASSCVQPWWRQQEVTYLDDAAGVMLEKCRAHRIEGWRFGDAGTRLVKKCPLPSRDPTKMQGRVNQIRPRVRFRGGPSWRATEIDLPGRLLCKWTGGGVSYVFLCAPYASNLYQGIGMMSWNLPSAIQASSFGRQALDMLDMKYRIFYIASRHSARHWVFENGWLPKGYCHAVRRLELNQGPAVGR